MAITFRNGLIDFKIINSMEEGFFLELWLGLRKIRICLCHRKRERSFKIGRHYSPLCSRCTAILVGLLSGLVATMFTDFVLLIPLSILLMLTFPMMVDGITQHLGWRESNNFLRAITGFLFGLSIISLEVVLIWEITMWVV